MNIVNIPPLNSKALTPVTIIDAIIRIFRITIAVLITTLGLELGLGLRLGLGLGLGLDSFSGKSGHFPMSVIELKMQFLQSYSEHRKKFMLRVNWINLL